MACWQQPYPFPSAHARFTYFRGPPGYRDYDAYDDTVCEVVLLSGLPGAGKDSWLRQTRPGRPAISLDDLREQMGVGPAGNQGQVVAAARERARVYLRRQQGFIWNATNVTRSLRRQLIGLFTDYGARVRIVYLEAPWPELARRNRARARPVPEAVLERLAGKLEVPDMTEAQQVEWIVA